VPPNWREQRTTLGGFPLLGGPKNGLSRCKGEDRLSREGREIKNDSLNVVALANIIGERVPVSGPASKKSTAREGATLSREGEKVEKPEKKGKSGKRGGGLAKPPRSCYEFQSICPHKNVKHRGLARRRKRRRKKPR